MTGATQNVECFRFAPAEVLGLQDVTEVAIYPDRVELCCAGDWRRFNYKTFARRQEAAAVNWFKRLFRCRAAPLVVGEREFCTERRYVLFFTEPAIRIFTPPDFDLPYGETYICRINEVLRRGGYATFDLS